LSIQTLIVARLFFIWQSARIFLSKVGAIAVFLEKKLEIMVHAKVSKLKKGIAR